MANVLKTGLQKLEKEAKVFSKIGLEVIMTFKGHKAKFYIRSANNNSVSALILETEEELDDFVGCIKTHQLEQMFKGVKEGDFIGYNKSTLQLVKKSKATTINIMEPSVYDVKMPTLHPTNKLRVDTKRIVDFVKESTALFKDLPTIRLKHVARELIMEVISGGDSMAEAIAITPLEGEMCVSGYGPKLLLEVLGAGKECVLEFGTDYPLTVKEEGEGFASVQILAPVVKND